MHLLGTFVAGLIVGAVGAIAALFVLLADREPVTFDEYGRLMAQRQRLIDAGVPASQLVVPLYPDPEEWVHG